MLRGNKALRLVKKVIGLATANQSVLPISAKHSKATLKFVFDIGSSFHCIATQADFSSCVSKSSQVVSVLVYYIRVRIRGA